MGYVGVIGGWVWGVGVLGFRVFARKGLGLMAYVGVVGSWAIRVLVKVFWV